MSWLNAASTLEFPESFDKNERVVFLEGEAYFDVKHADKVPFIIYTGQVSTEVLGTAFNIKAYPDLEKVTVSVNRGKVKVNYENKQVAMLTHGQQVIINRKVNRIKEKEVKEEESASWQQGKLMYDDYSVADILSDLESHDHHRLPANRRHARVHFVQKGIRRGVGTRNIVQVNRHTAET